MKTFKFNSEILIICCALIASGASALETRIGADGQEYIIEYDEKYTWFQARDECARHNSQLLTMDSPEKQYVIKELFKGADFYFNFWLGANDKFNESGYENRPFFWSSTGKQITNANWDDIRSMGGYYLHDNSNDHCVRFNLPNKIWFKSTCNQKNGFICEESYSNACVGVRQLIKDFHLLKNNMTEMNGQLENIKQVANVTKYEVDKLTNITQKILNKQEFFTTELNDGITKLVSDLKDQLKQSVDELSGKYNDKQNFTYPPIVLISQAG